MKYFIITYGCQMNVSDSERIAAVLEKNGYSPAPKKEDADLIVVNMCSVRQTAVDRVYGQVKNFIKLKKKNPKLKVILTGCVLKSDLKKFREKYDYVLSIKDLPHWNVQKLSLREPSTQSTECSGRSNLTNQGRDCFANARNDKRKIFRRSDALNCDYLKTKPKYTTKFSAYVPIIIGCNNFCSYCVVPYTRGPEFSRPVKDILTEVKKLVKKGYKEIWLLGENVNSYHCLIRANKTMVNFAQLLKMVNGIPGDFWVRFTSSHPKDFTDELIETIAKCEKITKYISLPAQSGDNKILKKMNRPYTLRDYKKIVKKIREKIPNVTLSTDAIVGFPGETKKQFENTVKLFEEIKPDMAYIAQYSPRPHTAAFKMKDTVSHKEKKRRDKVLTKALQKTALENNKKYIGKIVEVLPEYERKGYLIGKTKEYKTIKCQMPNIKCQINVKIQMSKLIGKIVKVKVTDVIPWGLKGYLINHHKSF